MKIFVSGTYSDIVPFRQAVIEQLNRMRLGGEKMEYFGASDHDPTTLSLEELEKCNVYLGIIGHRYGTLSPDGERSITRREYERAHELYKQGKMRLLLYLADLSVGVAANLIQKDPLRQKQSEFRETLQNRHTPKLFKSPDELAGQVAADLHWLEAAGGLQDDQEITIFDADEDTVIKEFFDAAATDRISRIHDFLEFVSNKFASLFNLDPRHINIHPFFKDIHGKLGSIIPGVYLDDKGGILERTGVRHVIMRTESMLRLLTNLNEQQLRDVGNEIGKSASADLIEHTIKRGKLFPSSGEAFVALWGYWDRTGGWGIITPVRSERPERGDTSTLHIKVENNFLQANDINETHRLCHFWCGYIHGFFTTALPKIADLMADLSGEKSNRVTLPAYHRVDSVTHLRDDKPTDDIFRVQFTPHPLSEALETLRDSRWPLKEGRYGFAMRLCRSSMKSAQQVLHADFDALITTMNLSDQDRVTFSQITDGALPGEHDQGAAQRWFEVTNKIIKYLSRTEIEAKL